MNNFTELIWKINKNGQFYFNNHLKEFNLGIGQYPLLSILFKEQELNQEQLSKIIGFNKASITKSIKKLLEEGLIIRKQDSKDKRMYRIFLTDKALQHKDKLLKLKNEWQSLLLVGFLPKEIKTLENLILRIRENSEKNKVL